MTKSIFQKKKKTEKHKKKKQITVLVSHTQKKIQLKSTTSKLFMHKPEHTGENLL